MKASFAVGRGRGIASRLRQPAESDRHGPALDRRRGRRHHVLRAHGAPQFSLLRAGLAATFLPMLVLMGVTFAFPNALGGTAGIVVCAIFVLISAAALLYRVNAVVHHLTPDMTVEGGHLIAIGVIVLFWNILSLLLRMRRR